MTISEPVSRVAVVADLHAKPETLESVCAGLRALLARFDSEIHPDLVVVLGDLVHGGVDRETDRRVLESVVDAFESAAVPVRYVPGNHDVATLERADLVDVFGHETWSIHEDFVFLDSSAPGLTGNRGEVGDEQRTALEERAGDLDRPAVFVHHPIGFRRLDDNRWFHDRPERAFCGDRIEVLDALAEIEPRLVVNGHLHWCDHVRDAGIEHVTVDAFTKELSPEADGAFAVVDLGDPLEVRLVEGSGFERSYRFPR